MLLETLFWKNTFGLSQTQSEYRKYVAFRSPKYKNVLGSSAAAIAFLGIFAAGRGPGGIRRIGQSGMLTTNHLEKLWLEARSMLLDEILSPAN